MDTRYPASGLTGGEGAVAGLHCALCSAAHSGISADRQVGRPKRSIPPNVELSRDTTHSKCESWHFTRMSQAGWVALRPGIHGAKGNI